MHHGGVHPNYTYDGELMNFVFYIMSVSMIFGKILFATSPFSVFINRQLIVSIGN